MVRRGSALAGPGAPGGLAPGPNPALEATPGLSLRTFIFVGVLLALCEPATSARAHPPDALRKMESSRLGFCHAGYFRDETGTCRPCQEGVDYTNYSNNLSSCFPCSICKNDKEEKSPCTTTRDTECRCRPGTFQDQNSPEYCRKCSDRCLDGMVEESPCGSWSDRKCVNKDSGTKATRENPATTDPVTANLNTTASLHPSSDYKGVIIGCTVGLVALIAVVLVGWKKRKTFAYVKTTRPSCGQHFPLVKTFCPLRRREAQDNDHNEILNIEQQREGQPLKTGVTEEFSKEMTNLQRPVETKRSPTRRRPLIPAKGTDTVETLRDFFRCHENYIPYKSWDKLMRLLGLTDNEILVIKDGINNREDALYEMMVKWLNKMGRDASINTLLDALEILGERNAREKIEDYMVKSGKFIYQEDGGDSAESFRKST